ncbi:MAG TPA: WYL domain-containing protein [Gemmatimonadaceae bacterium]|nr:WYL domain-containing protein [Gemmatimonadaceae bacterium]
MQRWIDVLAALLGRHYPVSFEDLRRDVPAYAAARPGATLMRMFERDKDELRAFGIPIETVELGDPPQAAYQLRRRDFYLPYVHIAAGGGAERRAIPPSGYRDLEQLAFEPDELEAVAHAAQRVRALGDPLLAAEAESAMRKLAFDLPVDVTRAELRERVIAEQVDARTFALLGRAVLRRKRAAFTYHAMSTDAIEEREVEPYGLVFVSGHWYLVARDLTRGMVRHFRLGRMRDVRIATRRPQTADFTVPSTFHLPDHARSRAAWMLGDGAEMVAVVDIRRDTGAARAAARLGEPVRGHRDRRRFQVRRPDTFARWLLSLGGAAAPVSPVELVERYREMLRATLAVYGDRAEPRA